MEFNLAEAQAKAGKTYVMQEPDPDCTVCDGSGIVWKTLNFGMNSQDYASYCDCTVKGLGSIQR